MTVVGLRDHEPRQEGAEREGGAGFRRAERRQGAQQDDRDQEQLPAPRFQYFGEQAGHDGACEDGDADHDQGRFPQRQSELGGTVRRPAGEKRQRQHDRDHA